jgi:hypothetical protein
MIFMQTTLATDAHLAEGQFLTGGADTEQSKIANTPRRNSETSSFQNIGAKLGSRINLSEKDSVEAVSSHT